MLNLEFILSWISLLPAPEPCVLSTFHRVSRHLEPSHFTTAPKNTRSCTLQLRQCIESWELLGSSDIVGLELLPTTPSPLKEAPALFFLFQGKPVTHLLTPKLYNEMYPSSWQKKDFPFARRTLDFWYFIFKHTLLLTYSIQADSVHTGSLCKLHKVNTGEEPVPRPRNKGRAAP